MKNKLLLTFISFSILFTGCQQDELANKRKELAEAKDELATLRTTIATLETEIAKLDTTQKLDNSILITVRDVKKRAFNHKITARGSIASNKNVMLSAETMGRIRSIRVTEGQKVSSGQVLLTLDADIIRKNIQELKTSLELATIVFEKQSRLWDKKIGTEIQYLEAKNNKESLENKLSTLNSELDKAIVKAPFAGIIDDLPAKLGEIAQPGVPLARVVSRQDMHIEADISERFLGSFKYGDSVEIFFPVQDKTYVNRILSVGEVINVENRTFSIEVGISNVDFEVKPNQVVVLKITDYRSNDAIVVPTEIILANFNEQFLFVIEEANGKLVAKKRIVTPGKTMDGETEILSGLSPNDRIVLAGYRDITDGVSVKISDESPVTAGL